MGLRVGNIVLRVDDLEREAAFWAAALGYERRVVDADDFAQVYPPDGDGPNLSFDRYRGAERVPPRIHLDLFTDDQAGEVARLVALGAREVHWDGRPADADYVILEDPEGNRFLRGRHHGGPVDSASGPTPHQRAICMDMQS